MKTAWRLQEGLTSLLATGRYAPNRSVVVALPCDNEEATTRAPKFLQGLPMRLDLSRDRALIMLASLLVMAPVLLIYWPAGNGLDVVGYPLGRDFINVWSGPQVAFGDNVATLFDLKAYHEAIGRLFGTPLPFHNWVYPLFTLAAFWPLAQLPYFWALAIWTIGLFAIFAAIVVREIEPARRLEAIVLLALAPACLINTIGGQNGFLSAALFLGGVLNIDRRPVLAGVLIGLLTFKPHLGLVLPFALVALGAWRVIAVAAVTAIALIGVSAAMFGLDAWAQYLAVTSAVQTSVMMRYEGFYTTMMVSVLACLRGAGIPYAGAMAVQVVVSALAIAGATWAVRQVADPCGRAFILVTAALLATPYALNYDMTALAAVLVWSIVGRLPWNVKAGPAYVLAWLAPPVVMMLILGGIGVASFITLLYLVALFGLAMRQALADGPQRLVVA
jgi:Glycosyltransferase family 87